MATELDPRIGNWYRDGESGRVFEVVAIDEDDGTVEIQYFESEVEEYDIDNWYEFTLEAIAAPEDWSGPFDDLVTDDFGDTEEPKVPEQWGSTLDDIDGEAAFEYGDYCSPFVRNRPAKRLPCFCGPPRGKILCR